MKNTNLHIGYLHKYWASPTFISYLYYTRVVDYNYIKKGIGQGGAACDHLALFFSHAIMNQFSGIITRFQFSPLLICEYIDNN